MAGNVDATPASYTWRVTSYIGTGADGNLTVASGATYNINTPNSVCADGGDGVSYSVTILTSSSAKLSGAVAAKQAMK
jgi:hypothetical protein